jgi:hypothetical protein
VSKAEDLYALRISAEDHADPQPGHAEPNGAIAAALLAAGVGCCAFGVAVLAATASEIVKQALDVYAPVGPLGGKSLVATGAWLITWTVAHLWLRARHVDLARWSRRSLTLIVVAFVATFPPVFELLHR